MTNAQKAVDAIMARIYGRWDNPSLTAVGPMTDSLEMDIIEIAEFYDPLPFALPNRDL